MGYNPQVTGAQRACDLLLRCLELAQSDAPTAAFALSAVYNLSSQVSLTHTKSYIIRIRAVLTYLHL